MGKEEIEKRAKEVMKILGKDKNFSEDFKIELFGNRYVLLSTTYFPYECMKDMEELFGGVGDFVLYRGGKRVGKKLVKEYNEYVKDKLLSIYDVLSAVGWYFGWALGEYIKEGENFRMILYDSFEAESYLKNEGESDKPVCHFMRGVLTGIVEEAEGEKYEGKELKCMAQGYNYCEFLIEKV